RRHRGGGRGPALRLELLRDAEQHCRRVRARLLRGRARRHARQQRHTQRGQHQRAAEPRAPTRAIGPPRYPPPPSSSSGGGTTTRNRRTATASPPVAGSCTCTRSTYSPASSDGSSTVRKSIATPSCTGVTRSQFTRASRPPPW